MAGLGMPYEVVDEKLSAGRGDEFSASAIVSSEDQGNHTMPLHVCTLGALWVADWPTFGPCRERDVSRSFSARMATSSSQSTSELMTPWIPLVSTSQQSTPPLPQTIRATK